MPADIFVSHSSKDGKVASAICAALEERGLECWIAPRNIGPGENFQETIVRAIRSAKVMILVFSTNTNESGEVRKELVLASQNKLAVIPIRVEDVVPAEAFAYELSTRQWVDLFRNWELEIVRVADQIKAILAGTESGPALSPSSPSRAVTTPPSARPTAYLPYLLGALVIVLIAGIGGYFALRQAPRPAVQEVTQAQRAPKPAPEPVSEPTGQESAVATPAPNPSLTGTPSPGLGELHGACPAAVQAAGGTALPDTPSGRADVAAALIDCASADIRAANLVIAGNEVAVAMSIADALVANAPNDRRFQHLLASCYARHGLVLSHEGNHFAAVHAYKTAVALHEDLVREAPENRVAKFFLAAVEASLARDLEATGAVDEARAALSRCIAEGKAAGDVGAEYPEMKRNIAACPESLARLGSGAAASAR